MVYAAIYGSQQGLDALAVRLTYYQVDTDQIQRFTRQFSRQQLEQFLQQLLTQYAPWAQRQLDWETRRSQSLAALQFPFAEYRPGQRALAGEVYRACRAGKSADRKGGTRVFCQAPTGIGKTMSALFPALKAMGEGCGAKLFYLTARNTTQAAAEDAIARLRAAQPGLALRSVTLTAKEKACLHPDAEGHPACLPEVCPFANGYYDRRKDALAALLDGSGSFSRAALADTARQFSVCPFELGLDLSEWCDVVIGDYNYLFDPVVHLKRFFDAAGDWLFLIDEAHNLPDRARAMYSAQFAKSSLTEAKRALGKGKSSLKTALTKADKVFLAARKACAQAAPRTGAEPAAGSLPNRRAFCPPRPSRISPYRSHCMPGMAPCFCSSCLLPCPPSCGRCTPRYKTGWNRTPRIPPTPSCWNSTLPCRISPAQPTGTTAILSPSLPPGAASWNCICSA